MGKKFKSFKLGALMFVIKIDLISCFRKRHHIKITDFLNLLSLFMKIKISGSIHWVYIFMWGKRYATQKQLICPRVKGDILIYRLKIQPILKAFQQIYPHWDEVQSNLWVSMEPLANNMVKLLTYSYSHIQRLTEIGFYMWLWFQGALVSH
jgi:hypothetical protein